MTESDVILSEVADSDGVVGKTIFVKVPPKGGKGRPAYRLTEEGVKLIEHLASLNSTQEEIQAVMGVSYNTLRNRYNWRLFEEAYKKGKEKFTFNIRESQQRILAKDNASMAIFLGKNYLGQTDKSEMQLTHKTPSEMSVEELFEKLAGKKE